MRAALLALLASLGAGMQARAQTPLNDAALDAVRGGYVSAGGLSFDFGAQVRTFVDDKLVLESRLTLDDQGLTIGAPAGGFVTTPGQGGETQVMHLLDPARLGSVILNTASNRQIRQDTDLTVVVPGLADLQGQIGLQRLGSQLNAAAASGVITRLGR